MDTKKIFLGILFILAGALLVAQAFGFVIQINIWSLLLNVALVYWCIKSLFYLDFGGTIFSGTILFCINAKALGIENFSSWTLIIAALLVSIGIDCIFPKIKRHPNKCKCNSKIKHENDKYMNIIIDEPDEKNIDVISNFTGTAKYVNVEGLQSLNIQSTFSGVSIYLDKATLGENGATINLDVKFSGIELHVPREWRIVSDLNTVIGGIDEKNKHLHQESKENMQVITLKGSLVAAGIEIIYC